MHSEDNLDNVRSRIMFYGWRQRPHLSRLSNRKTGPINQSELSVYSLNCSVIGCYEQQSQYLFTLINEAQLHVQVLMRYGGNQCEILQKFTRSKGRARCTIFSPLLNGTLDHHLLHPPLFPPIIISASVYPITIYH